MTALLNRKVRQKVIRQFLKGRFRVSLIEAEIQGDVIDADLLARLQVAAKVIGPEMHA
jgi:hypothetical protein